MAVEPHRPPVTNVGTKTAFSDMTIAIASISKKVNIFWGQRSVDAIAGLHRPQKKHSPRSEFTPELHWWISWVTARHLQILHYEIFWSPWYHHTGPTWCTQALRSDGNYSVVFQTDLFRKCAIQLKLKRGHYCVQPEWNWNCPAEHALP